MLKPPSINIFSAPPVFLVAALVIAGVFLVAGCEHDVPPEARPTRIVILDVSASTINAREDYYEHFKATTREFALQKGEMQVIVAAGDPLVESNPKLYDFSPAPELIGRPSFETSDLCRQADDASDEVYYDLLENSPVENRERTALLRAFVLADRVAGSPAGEFDIVVYSDGLENTDLYIEDLENDGTIAEAIDRLEDEDLIPTKLSGVPIRWVLPGYDPDGSEGAPDPRTMERFWKAWAKRAGAELTWGEPLPEEISETVSQRCSERTSD